MVDLKLLDYLEGFLTEERKQKFIQVLNQRTKHFTVVIEDLFQMHNTSAVIRNCDVFGIQEAHVIEERYGAHLDKNIAMGAQKWVDVFRYKTTSNCIKALKCNGYQIIATTPHSESCLLNNFDIDKPTAFFFGTERDGLSQEVIDQADGFLKIPMNGFTESLNVSVAVAILLQNVTSKLRKSNVEWELSDNEVLTKRIDWSKKSIRSVNDILSRYKK